MGKARCPGSCRVVGLAPGLPPPHLLGGMRTLAVSKTALPAGGAPRQAACRAFAAGGTAAPGPVVGTWRGAHPLSPERRRAWRQGAGQSWRGGGQSPVTVLAQRSAAARSEGPRRWGLGKGRPAEGPGRGEARRRSAEPRGRQSLAVAGGAAGDLARKRESHRGAFAVCEPCVIPAGEDISPAHTAEKENAARSSNPAKGPSHLVPPLPPLTQPLS